MHKSKSVATKSKAQTTTSTKTPRKEVKKVLESLLEFRMKAGKPESAPALAEVWCFRMMRVSLKRSKAGKLFIETANHHPYAVTLRESVERFALCHEYEGDGQDYGDSWSEWLADIAKAL